MDLYKLLVISISLEALWETLKMIWQQNKISVDRIGAMVLSVFLCISANVDFFEMVGIPLQIPYAGMVLSGLLISRGANFVHDLLNAIQGLKQNGK